uniref:Bowman-Birk type trypsin inhibitor isoform X2 n=1 Tax=Elaeis guineensis var. tenera TaxID=51953 RepID=A0A6I9SGU9_ELAGV|nr:Bowman-Birk type trypsin inhibitor isoform X2 [Elaeis guineensis]
MRSRVVVLALMMVLAVVFFANNSFAQDEVNFQAPSEDDAGGRPWPCCNKCGVCTRSNPPQCQCLDLVKACHPKCKECVQSPLRIYPPLYQCKDWITNFCKKKCNPKPLNDE